MKTKLHGRHWFVAVASTALLLGALPFSSVQAASTAYLSPSSGAGFYAQWLNSAAVVNEAVGCPTPLLNTAWRGDAINTRTSANILITTVPDGATINSVDVQVCQQRAGTGVDGATFQTFIRVDATNTDSGINITAATPVGSPVANIQSITLAGGVVKSGTTTLEVGTLKTNAILSQRIETIAAQIFFTLPGSTTTVSCASPIGIGSTSLCTATVAPSAGGNTPTGAVAWSTSDGGSFSGESCTPGTGEQTCTATFTPSAVGAPTVTATYPGDSNMTGSAGNANVTVNKLTSTTTVSCSSPIIVGSDSLCTATVAAVGGSITPTGTVSWATNDSGSFSNQSCTPGTGSQTCTATFTPGGLGSPTVTATYAGDANITGSNNTDDVQVNVPPVAAPVPVFGPIGLLLTMLGVGLVGAWQARRKA